MNERPTSEVLNLAADLIEERGWTRGGGADGEGWHPTPGSTTPLCLEGAIRAASGMDDKHNCPAWLVVSRYLRGRPDAIPSPILADGVIVFGWNDRPHRTQAEVVEVLRATAVIEAARETAHERETAEVTP